MEADAFVQVSRTEGQPLGVMEAMCLGMPVILSKGTGYESVINEKKVGLLTSTNSKEIASAILEMYYNRDKLNEYSRNSYCFAIENYSWSKIVKKTVEFYTNITKK